MSKSDVRVPLFTSDTTNLSLSRVQAEGRLQLKTAAIIEVVLIVSYNEIWRLGRGVVYSGITLPRIGTWEGATFKFYCRSTVKQ